MKIVVRAFNKDGYHKDILTMNEKQVLIEDARIEEPTSSVFSGLIGHGGRIRPEEFAEMAYFEIVVQDRK